MCKYFMRFSAVHSFFDVWFGILNLIIPIPTLHIHVNMIFASYKLDIGWTDTNKRKSK